MKQQLKKPSNVPNKIEIKVVSSSIRFSLICFIISKSGSAEHNSGGFISPGLAKLKSPKKFSSVKQILKILLQVHSIPSNKVDTLKTKLWIEFDGEVTIVKVRFFFFLICSL